jgi:hypothetical protein
MLPNLYAWAAAALSVAFVNAADSPPSFTPVGSLYAYGKGISGLPLMYSDGKSTHCRLYQFPANVITRRPASRLGRTCVRTPVYQPDL